MDQCLAFFLINAMITRSLENNPVKQDLMKNPLFKDFSLKEELFLLFGVLMLSANLLKNAVQTVSINLLCGINSVYGDFLNKPPTGLSGAKASNTQLAFIAFLQISLWQLLCRIVLRVKQRFFPLSCPARIVL